ncbi:MAG: type II secretion system GspH family protein [Bacillus sp. (in: Bacteria)]|nr:type II secretion system GspH family protein [Bacillus sp. (in: firmicutes)]
MSNQRGFTLVELLLSITIMSVVAILITSMFMFGQNQVKNQTSAVDHQANVRLAMNMITREIRRNDPKDVEATTTQLKINSQVVYQFDGTNLTDKDNKPVVEGVTGKFTPNSDSIKIDIDSVADRNGNKVSQSTTIYLRK